MVAPRSRRGQRTSAPVADSRKQRRPEDHGEQNAHRWQTTVRNLVLITALVVGPYVGMRGYEWVHLKSGWVRPALEVGHARQVLIFGVQGSGTTQTTARLVHLGIEVAHESSDAKNTYCRDGTVSWVHGMMALPPPSDHEKSVKVLCEKPRPNILHSTQFEPPDEAKCSTRVLWSTCWRQECERVMRLYHGCLLRNDCPTRFSSYLLQIRHPLKNIASLVVKFCKTAGKHELPHPDVLAVLEALYPSIEWAAMQGGCVEVFSNYWLAFNANILNVVSKWYRVEETPPCAIASMAGFLDEADDRGLKQHSAYAPTVYKARAECAQQGFGTSRGEFKSLAKPPTSGSVSEMRGTINQVNKGRLNVTLQQIREIDEHLADQIVHLATRTFAYSL
ncbi:hypothetical protein FVE85_8578 [Porphyridium purpureum]|uniref:Sulfotransferase domain-containing protein n=1 Tax=Porphyridium purpureum TaxID=35688 RepID=A0A5J4YQS4_PORPP|nr:hypothetical protein FVE85_8578 [Porphyridium purpureum]|eukprot:POR7170..scf296_7